MSSAIPVPDDAPFSAPGPAFRITISHAAVPGRVRLRIFGLKRSPRLKSQIEARLHGLSIVRRADASVTTGTVLVVFDPGVDPTDLVEALNGARPGPAARQPSLVARPVRSTLQLPAAVGDALKLGLAVSQATLHVLIDWARGAAPVPASPRPPAQAIEAPAVERWHTLEGPAVVERLGGDAAQGLSLAEAEQRLRRYGPNLLTRPDRRSLLALFAEQFMTAPVAMLGVSAAVSVATGGVVDAAAILVVVLINAVIGTATEGQSERIIASLDDNTPRHAVVYRGGAEITVEVDQIVPGDLLLLSPGTYVAADARLLDTHRLSVDESALTGESLPADKSSRPIERDDTPLAERANMVFMGTLVTGGSARAVVVATGSATEIGRIQALVTETKPPDTPMERQLEGMGRQLVWLSSATCAGVFLVGLLRGYPWLTMLSASISLAVAAVPEGLPTVATTTLALGIRDMRRRKVLIRHLDAVETLGAVQVFCLDKTGTLTENRMQAAALFAGMDWVDVDAQGFDQDGRPFDPLGRNEIRRLCEVVVLCSEVELDPESGEPVRGSPTENALVRLALAAGIDVAALRRTYPLMSMRHRSETRLFMRTRHHTPEGGELVAVKGSPAEVLARSTWHVLDGERIPLTDADRERILAANDRMAGDALRVLGVAYALPEGSYRGKKKWTWLGLAGMADPVRPGMRRLLAQFHEAGIGTVMITGDQSATAYAIGKQLDLAGGSSIEILESTALERLDPELLAGVVKRVQVFARVSPAHKLQIVQALQQAGRVVAMTGDGVNDGPALTAAEIGVAMGGVGTDVARSVSDVILEDDNLHTMVVAVEQGRAIYDNIRKALRFLLSTNFTEIELMFLGIALGLGQPLSTMQLLWINLISDIFPGLALALEPAEPDIMKRPPRDPQAPIIAGRDFRRLGIESAVITTGALAAYLVALRRYGPGPRATTNAFMSLSLGQLLHALSCRSERHSLYGRERLPRNRYLELALGTSLAAQLATVLLPPLRRLLGNTPLGPADWLMVAVSAIGPLLINEATKPIPRLGARVEKVTTGGYEDAT